MLLCLWTVAVTGWLVVIALAAMATRSRHVQPAAPAPAGRDEPPAVVSLLARQLKHTGYAATLLDLRARGWFSVTDAGAGQAMCRLQPAATWAGQTPYEDRVLAHVRRRADADGTMPAAALGTGFDVGEKDFLAGFSAEVRADAARRGLIRSRISGATVVLLAAAGLPAAVLSGIALLHAGAAALIVLPCGYTVVMAMPIRLQRGYRLTPAGRAALAQWLGSGLAVPGGVAGPSAAPALATRRIAYAAALGAAPEAIRPFAGDQARPWSSFGGRWRQVTIGKPDERTVPGPVMIGFALALCCLFGLLVVGIRSIGGGGWALVFAFFPGVVFWGPTCWLLWSADRARRLPPLAEFDGQVVRRWSEQRNVGSGDETVTITLWCVAIDDGKRDQAWSLTVTAPEYEAIRAGTIVHVRVDPRRNRLLAMTPAP